MRHFFTFTFLALSLFCAGQAEATITQKTSYNYFVIKGRNAREIYTSLLKHARGPSGHDAYATTAFKVFQKSRLITAPSCRFQKLELRATFVITLPKLQPAQIAGTTNQNWQIFANALLAHEQHHRSIWMACMTSLEQAAQGLQTKSCSSLTAKFNTIWKSIESVCTKRNNAFDAAEQRALLKQPFIQMVAARR